MKRILTRYFNSWWFPALVYICLLGGFAITAIIQWRPLAILANVIFCATVSFIVRQFGVPDARPILLDAGRFFPYHSTLIYQHKQQETK